MNKSYIFTFLKNGMRIKFLNTPFFRNFIGSYRTDCSYLPSLGMAEITSLLRSNGYHVDQEDLHIKFFRSGLKKEFIKRYKKGEDINPMISKIVDLIDYDNQDLFLISARTFSYKPNVILSHAIIRAIKKRYNRPIIIGGKYEKDEFLCLLEEKIIDYIIYDDPSVILKILQGKNKKKLEGVFYLDKDKVVYKERYDNFLCKDPPHFKKRDLKFYRWNPDKNFMHPLLRNVKKNPNLLVLPLKFIKGCPNKCAFCISSKENRLTLLPPEDAVDLIARTSKMYKTNCFMFLHDAINFSKEYVKAFCETLIDRKVKIFWCDCGTTMNIDRKIADLLVNSGCVRLFFGLETGSPNLLKYIGKNLTIEDFSKGIKHASKSGIWTGVDLICGFPYETDKDIDRTIQLINKHKQFIDEINVNYFHLLSRSLFFSNPQKFKIKIRQNEYFSGLIGRCYAFDEATGLRWEEKKEQMKRSYDRYLSEIGINETVYFEGLWFIYYLKNQGFDKTQIKEVYDAVIPRLAFKKYPSRVKFAILKNKILKGGIKPILNLLFKKY